MAPSGFQLPLIRGTSLVPKDLLKLRSHAQAWMAWKAGEEKENPWSLTPSGSEFEGFRPWQEGDSVRTLDVRASQRSGKAIVSLYSGSDIQPLRILLDCSPSMHFGSRICSKLVAAAQIAAYVGWCAVEEKADIELVCLGLGGEGQLAPGRGEMHGIRLCHSLCQALATSSNTESSVPSRPLSRLSDSEESRSILISDFSWLADSGSSTSAGMRRLLHTKNLYALAILDPLDHQLPHATLPIDSGGHEGLLQGHLESVQSSWKQCWLHAQQQLNRSGCRWAQHILGESDHLPTGLLIPILSST